MYEVYKIAHLASMVAWVGSMLMVPAVIKSITQLPYQERKQVATRFRKTYLVLGGVGIIGAWVFGMALMLQAGWMNSTWMMLKIGVVVVLSGAHGFLSGQVRQLATNPDYRAGRSINVMFWTTLILVSGAIALVVLKPF